MDVGDFGSVDVKRRNSNPFGDIVPVTHDVFVCGTHGKRTALDKDQAWPSCLLTNGGFKKTTHVFVVVVPSGYG